jgi:hypothetical protein
MMDKLRRIWAKWWRRGVAWVSNRQARIRCDITQNWSKKSDIMLYFPKDNALNRSPQGNDPSSPPGDLYVRVEPKAVA